MFSSDRICKSWNSKYAGKVAGATRPDGYKVVSVLKNKVLVHRVIFLLAHGYLPLFIDHIDGNPSNNLIENLREITLSRNQYNKRRGISNTSGAKGVSWSTKYKKWIAQIIVDGRHVYLGGFCDKQDAIDTYTKASIDLHGEFSLLSSRPEEVNKKSA